MDVDEIDCINKWTHDHLVQPSKEQMNIDRQLKELQLKQVLVQWAKWAQRKAESSSLGRQIAVEQEDDVLMSGRHEVWNSSPSASSF